MRVADVAMAVGYSDSAHFVRAFQKWEVYLQRSSGRRWVANGTTAHEFLSSGATPIPRSMRRLLRLLLLQPFRDATSNRFVLFAPMQVSGLRLALALARKTSGGDMHLETMAQFFASVGIPHLIPAPATNASRFEFR